MITSPQGSPSSTANRPDQAPNDPAPVAGGPPGRPPRAAGGWRAAMAALLEWQIRRPLLVLLLAAISAAIAGVAASRLTLDVSLGELLPQGKESVLVANRVNDRLPSATTLVIAAEGGDPAAMARFIDDLAPRIRALGPDLIGDVDTGVRASQEFFEQHRLLYAPLADLQAIHDAIEAGYEREVRRRAGFDLELDDEPGAEPAGETAAALARRLAEREREERARAEARFPGGHYLDPAGRLIAMLARTGVPSGDVEGERRLVARIAAIVADLDPSRYDPAIRVGYTGDLVTGVEQYAQIKDDLSHVGALGVAMILGVVLLFFLRPRALAAITLAVATGVVWTFGVARLAVGHLNSSTGFLVSIVVGNGINFGIIYVARYLEARRDEDLARSLRAAHEETSGATLAAAGAAAVAYGSLAITDFRGFKHFGVIGGSGMLLCWLSTYLVLPSLLALLERLAPLRPGGPLAARLRGAYGKPFAALVGARPRAVAIAGALSGVAAAGLAIHYVASDPMEYDLSRIRTEPELGDSPARRLARRVEAVRAGLGSTADAASAGRQSQDGVAILADRLDQVLPLKAALEARRDAAGARPFDRVVTIFDLLPRDQEAKIALLERMRDRVERARRRGLLDDAAWAELAPFMPEAHLRPLGVDDLPDQVARPFIERDGTRGRIVYVTPTPGRSLWDARYLTEWSDAVRSTALPDGSVVKGSGRSVIFSDVIRAVNEDAPRSILASIAGTLLVVAIAFRFRRPTAAVIAALALGLCWMVAFMAAYHARIEVAGGVPRIELEGMRLNFLNFVALPITVGVGADYAVNVVQRYRLAGPGQIGRVIRETGGAVILCSLTTTLGYLALTASINGAIKSFGVAAAAGEIACLLAAVVVLPAALEWRDRRRAAARADRDQVSDRDVPPPPGTPREQRKGATSGRGHRAAPDPRGSIAGE